MRLHSIILALLFSSITLLFSCTQETKQEPDEKKETKEENPPAEGFNMAASDEKAIAIADEVMKAMGGRESWDTTRYISWNFFGRRQLIWDKQENRVRIDMNDGSMASVLDMDDGTGMLNLNGELISDVDTLQKYLERTKSIWINDSYWLAMPYKLKDSGVTLKYVREDTTQMGIQADFLQLTFENVGNTPQNKYEVAVDKNDKLVVEWAYFPNATDSAARFITPWQTYQKKGDIMLSGDRGQYQLTDINVYQELPESIFTSLEPVDLSQYTAL